MQTLQGNKTDHMDQMEGKEMNTPEAVVDRELVAAIAEEVKKMSLDEVKAELELMEPEEVAEKTKMGRSTVYHYAEDGIIPSAKWGTLVRFRPRALLMFQIYKERTSEAKGKAA